jgi:hypothetical protein
VTREWIFDPAELDPIPERRRRPSWQRYAISAAAVLVLGVLCGLLAVVLVLTLAAYAAP